MFAWLLVPVGVVIAVYADKITDTIGDFEWVESWMGIGSTHTFIKLVGIATSILAFMYSVGGLDSVFSGLVKYF